MKKLLLILLCLPLLFSSCKKEEGCTDPVAINYNVDAESDDGSCDYGSIAGIWKPDSVIIYLLEEEFSLTGQRLYFYDTIFTRPPEYVGILGNMQFTDEGVAIIEFVNNIDTGSYTISGNVFSHYESDGDLGAVFDYSVSYSHLILSRSISETDNDYDGYDIFTREETLYLSKQ